MTNRQRLACLGVLILPGLGLSERPARAAPFRATLAYTAGPSCPDAADLKAIVVARLGHDPFTDSAPDHVLVNVVPRDGGLEGRIEWRDATGKWAGDQSFPLAGTDCPGLVRAMGFALAVQIQMLAPAGEPPAPTEEAPAAAEREPPAARPAPTETPPVAPPANEVGDAATITNVRPPPRADSSAVFAIGAGPSVGLGMSSRPIVLGRLSASLAWRKVSAELAALASLPATTRRADGAGFTQRHLLISAATCAVRARWNACVVANAGAVRMVGQDIDRPSSAWVPIVQAGARVGAAQPLGRRAFLNAHADGLINVTRWTGRLDDVPVWTSPRFAAAFTVEAGLLFP